MRLFLVPVHTGYLGLKGCKTVVVGGGGVVGKSRKTVINFMYIA